MPAPENGAARRRPRPTWKTAVVACAAAVGVLQFSPRFPQRVIDTAAAADSTSMLTFVAHAAREALGRSGAVRMETALPGGEVRYPLLVSGDVAGLAYQWVSASDSTPRARARPFTGEELVAPDEPGFYQLALVRDSVRRVVGDLTLAVLVPFTEKQGARLNGYLLGTWAGERRGGDAPEGFVQVTEADLALPLSKHVRLADFLPEDGQERVFPRYAAVEEKLLDKLELVLAQLDAWAEPGRRVTVDVNAGFRSPSYNRRVSGSANASRHQHGDAIDVAIDANGDGRVNRADISLVTKAVEAVERANPDLAGGLGLYVSGNYRRPFVHIDTRGHRARWTG